MSGERKRKEDSLYTLFLFLYVCWAAPPFYSLESNSFSGTFFSGKSGNVRKRSRRKKCCPDLTSLFVCLKCVCGFPGKGMDGADRNRSVVFVV